MSIRLDILFAEPVDGDGEVRMRLAAAALPEVRRAVLAPDRRRATWYAGEMAVERAIAALREAGLPAEVRSTLAPEADSGLATPPGERFRPIGR